MPQRKNPTPKRVPEDREETSATEDVDQTQENRTATFPDDPELLRDIPKESLYREDEADDWTVSRSDKNEDGKYICPKCGRDYTTVSGLRYHLQHLCEKVCRFRFTCLVCGEKLAQLEETLKHIADKHLKIKPSTRRKTRKDQSYLEGNDGVAEAAAERDSEDFVPSGEESDDDDNDADIPSDDDDFSLRRTRGSTSTPRKSSKSTTQVKSSFASIEQPFHETLRWLFDFLFPLEKKYGITHSNFVPRFEKWTLNKEFDLLNFSKSPSYQVFEEQKKACLYECPGIEPFCAFVPLESSVIDLNAGGPVQALSWCPVPIKEYGSRQYLAMSAHSGLHSPDECYHENGLIQIWDCGELDLHDSKHETPKFLFGISCNEAPIWELKWCPIGGKITGKKGGKTAKPRLGILAAACASGVILILPVPDVTASDITDGGIFNAMPEMVLVPNFAEKVEREKDFGQCLSVDWSLSDGGEWIAGGYSRGIVVLWKIKDPPSILLSEESGCKQLVSCRIFFAHNRLVQSLCWCPYDETVIATSGHDRYVKIWNRNFTETPLMTSQAKISMPTEISWPILWCGVFTSTEEVFAGPWYHGLLYHDVFNRLTSPFPIIPFKAACLSFSFSDWMNCVVAGDSTGCAVIVATSNWNRKIKLPKKKIPRIQLFNTEVNWLSEDTEEDVQKEEHSSGQEQENYLLSFHDTNFKNLKNIEKRACFRNVRVQDNFPTSVCDKPYVQAVKKMAWNPNFGSHSWIAVGMQCGLVRLQHVGNMHSQTMDEIVEDLKEKLAENSP